MTAESPKQSAWSKRIQYPHDGPLTKLPTDWKSKIHKPLARSDFHSEVLFCQWWHQVSLAKAKYWERRAKDAAEFGAEKAAKKKQQLQAALEKAKRLQDELTAHGVKV